MEPTAGGSMGSKALSERDYHMDMPVIGLRRRVPMQTAKGATAASRAPRERGQTSVCGLRKRRDAKAPHNGRARDSPCGLQSRNQDKFFRAFSSAHRATPSPEWKPPRCWPTWHHP